MLFLQSAQTGNSTGDWFEINTTGEYVFRYFGTFDGATIALQSRAVDAAGNVEGIEIPTSSQTAAHVAVVFLESGAAVRAVISGVGASTNLDVTLNKAH